jgi:hypothetical protein
MMQSSLIFFLCQNVTGIFAIIFLPITTPQNTTRSQFDSYAIKAHHENISTTTLAQQSRQPADFMVPFDKSRHICKNTFYPEKSKSTQQK